MKIDCEKLERLQKHHVSFNLIDIRSSQEYQAQHIDGAINIPSDIFLKKLTSTVSQKDAAIVIYDANDETCEQFVAGAEKLGYLNIVSLEGGFNEYLRRKRS